MKTILVTGGNRGIGKEIIRQLAGMGHKMILGCRDLTKGREALNDLNGDISLLQIDLSDPDSISHAVKTVQKNFRQPDVLINNAAIIDGGITISNADPDQTEAVIRTNYLGPLRLTRLLLPLLRQSTEGRIINISSGMGASDSLSGDYPGYRLSKAHLNDMTQMFANDLQNDSVQVFSMCPGWVRTDMGGPGASRSVEKGAETAVWLAITPEATSGRFYRDKKIIPW